MVNHLKTVAAVRKTAQAPHADCAEQLEILYDHYRDAFLNQKYYGHRYVHIERSNSAIENCRSFDDPRCRKAFSELSRKDEEIWPIACRIC